MSTKIFLNIMQDFYVIILRNSVWTMQYVLQNNIEYVRYLGVIT